MSSLDWTLIDCERLVYFQKKVRKFCYKLSVLAFYHKQAATRLGNSFQLAVFYFFMNCDNISFFPIDGKFPAFNSWFKNKFKIESPKIFNMQNADHVKAVSFICIKVFNDFSNVIFTKRDSWKEVTFYFKGINREFAGICN